jgi:hypothetical protein
MIKSTNKSLKNINQPKLISFVVVNVILMSAAIAGYEKTIVLFHEVGGGNFQSLVRLIGFPTTAGIALGVLSWFIPKAWKETLVFWRVGVRRLPSSVAFTSIAPTDLRVDMSQLTAQLGSLPTDNKQQSALWYSIYRKHSEEKAVVDAHAAYLLYREMTALVPILMLGMILVVMITHSSLTRMTVLLGSVLVEGLVVGFAARNAGTRLVSNVLAIEAADFKKPLNSSSTAQRKTNKK